MAALVAFRHNHPPGRLTRAEHRESNHVNQLKLGLIGFGKWVREACFPILRETPEVRVVAAAAPSETSRTFARGALGPDVAVYRDYGELLGNPEVEAVMIALPNALHAPGDPSRRGCRQARVLAAQENRTVGV